jgi:hypothetical protein
VAQEGQGFTEGWLTTLGFPTWVIGVKHVEKVRHQGQIKRKADVHDVSRLTIDLGIKNTIHLNDS